MKMLNVVVCLFGFSLISHAEVFKVENSKLLLEFDQRASEMCLSRIIDKKDGFNVLDKAAKTPLWEIEFSKKGADIKTKFRGGSSGEPVDFIAKEGDIITIDSLSCNADVSHSYTNSDHSAMELTWKSVELPDKSLAEVKVTVELRDNLSFWQIAIDSKSEIYSLWKIRFVQVKGFTREKNISDEFWILPAGTGQRNPMIAEGAIEWVYPSSCMGMQMSAYILEQKQKGIFFACYDKDANTKKYVLSNENGILSHYWEHYPENMGSISGTYKLAYPVVLGVFDGDWFEASQIYKTWATKQFWCDRGKMSKNDIPQWYKETHLWKRPDGDPNAMTKNMLEFKEWFQMPFAVQWYCWNVATYDTLYPDFFPSRSGFSSAVTAMEKEDVRIFPYINGLLCDPKNETWKEGAEKWVSKTVDGKLYPYPVENNFWSYHMCPSTKFWQEKIRSVCQKLESEASTSGIYFDCVGGMDTKLCFDKSHGHPLGGGHYWHAGFRKMMSQIRNDFRTRQHPISFATELMAEPLVGSFDGALMCTIDSEYQIPLLTAVYGEYIISYGRGERWEDWEQDGCFENREAESFVFGAQLGWQVGSRAEGGSSSNFELAPNYIERTGFFKELVKARIAGANYIVYGTMMKPLNLGNIPTVSLEGSYKVFGGKAVVKPVIYNSVWKDETGKIGLFFVNSSKDDVTVSYTVDPNDYGLNRAKALSIGEIYPSKSDLYETYDCKSMVRSDVVKAKSVLILEIKR